MVHKPLLTVPLALAILAVSAGAYAAAGSTGPRMGPPHRVSRQAFLGYYDGHKDTYLNTDVSNKAEAKAMHVNYSPILKTVPLATAPEMYLVQGKAAAGQLAVFGSEPGEPTYSPIWRETILMWRPSATPVLIKSDTQIDKLESDGVLSERSTAIRLNCPIIKVPAAHAAAGTFSTTAAKPDPDAFVARIDNPWLPFRPGTTAVYRGAEEGKASRDVVTVTALTRTIEGVRATAVRDLLYLGGKLGERTTDWYAQDRAGNVWYFGEATAELNAKGKVTSREGSWVAGVDGAQAGIVMPARPRVGQRFRQEDYKGHAEDYFQVLSVSTPVRVPAAASKRAVLTKEWSPLEPGVIDHKLYVRGIGLVKEQTVKGPAERSALVSLHRG